MAEDIVSIDWCDDTIRRTLPWDEDQYVEVKRFTNKERKRKQTLMTRFSHFADEAAEVQLRYDEVAQFDYQTAITDFRLKDKTGKVLLFGKPSENSRIYDHFTGRLADFVDGLIAEVNMETEAGAAEISAVAGNSESSSPDSSAAVGED